MTKTDWVNWLKCNVLEIIILVLVTVLLVKTFSMPAAEATVKETAVGPQEQLQVPSAVPRVVQPVQETAKELPVMNQTLPVMNQTLQNKSNTQQETAEKLPVANPALQNETAKDLPAMNQSTPK